MLFMFISFLKYDCKDTLFYLKRDNNENYFFMTKCR